MPPDDTMVSLAKSPSTSALRVVGRSLTPGEVQISGFKHAAVGLIAATVMLNRPVVVSNCPMVADTLVLSEIIQRSGGRIHRDGHDLNIDPRSMHSTHIPESLSSSIHGSLYLLPAYLARFGQVSFGQSGGCQIGATASGGVRPISHMISVMERFGAQFEYVNGRLVGYSSGFQSTTIDILDYSNVQQVPNGPMVSGATKTAILCALGCNGGETRILHPYRKPDVLELLDFARNSGYAVTLTSEGISIARDDSSNEMSHELVSCLSEIMTFITLSVHAHVEVRMTHITNDRAKAGLKAELELLSQMGVDLQWEQDKLTVTPPKVLYPTKIEVTSQGIFSDHQPFFTLMLTRASGISQIRDCVWNERFSYVGALNQLGARISRRSNGITIVPSRLTLPDQILVANDLRSAAVLLLSSLTVPGITFIRNTHHLLRGYQDLPRSLGIFGAHIDEVSIG